MSAVTELILGHALWVAALAYMLGGMLGMGLALVGNTLWAQAARLIVPRMQHRHGY
jgi:hypothetical protein